MQKLGLAVLGCTLIALACDAPTTSPTNPIQEDQSSGEALTQTSTVQQWESVSTILVLEENGSPQPQTLIIAGQPLGDGDTCDARATLEFRVAVPGEGTITVEIANVQNHVPAPVLRPGVKYTRVQDPPIVPGCDKGIHIFAHYNLASKGS